MKHSLVLLFSKFLNPYSGRGTKFGMIKCRTTDITEFQKYEY